MGNELQFSPVFNSLYPTMEGNLRPTPSRRHSRSFKIRPDTIITGRKSWKTMKNKQNEPVWPPEIEAALIEALEKYRPHSASIRNPKEFRRFPKRNIFISDEIFKKTGKSRTAKQVGSRLQQLRDTCEDERVLELLTRREYSPEPDSSSTDTSADSPVSETTDFALASPLSECTASSSTELSSESSRLSPLSSVSFDETGYQVLPAIPRNVVVRIEICHQESTRRGHSPLRHSFEPVPPKPSYHRRIILSADRPLWTLSPTVTFTSSRPTSASTFSSFTVYANNVPVHSEVSPLLPHAEQANPASCYAYRTKFLPEYWVHLCERYDLAQCTVTQTIIEPRPSDEVILLSLVYEFSHTYPTPSPILYSRSSTGPALPPHFAETPACNVAIPPPLNACSDRNFSHWPTACMSQPQTSAWAVDHHDLLVLNSTDPHYSLRGHILASGYGEQYSPSDSDLGL
ncbi:uncharacterized protein BT62DRAFT_1008226 [Guyanagaster necrorhizus]|uniref:TEA domain-containing protein n=1 Tax=Guyanagaster necrorhizus TaxID=856835 RepID=A0A9P7VPZ9_9AGAR|nr:uncharacterized protein BT62DRAFT_1008226 [Guyanagaster necrorhizus MCA 3950]KAG7444563.1 hypothetical protein BT62DRAFT_1008226 [Guyanagaster necrorhizus MCA 3950]